MLFHALQTKLHEVIGTHQENISSAPMPILEHFALVLGGKPNHLSGVGIRAVNRVAEEMIRLHLEHVQMLLSNVLRLQSNEHKL